MKKIAIYGAGGHGKVIADTALVLGWSHIDFYDEIWPKQNNLLWKIVGNFHNLTTNLNHYTGIVVGIGDSSLRLKIHNDLNSRGANMVSLVHPKSYVSSFAEIGKGSVIFAGGVVNYGSKVGQACIINTGATVDHDCKLYDGVHICPGANIAGGVVIGPESLIGVGAAIKPGLSIGSKVTIGAGAVIVKDVGDHSTMVGVAAKYI